MFRDLIIDGYNLMHAAGFARRSYGPGGLERARHRLLARLTELLTIEERQRTTVVFDAKDAPPDVPNADVRNEIYVQFAHDTDEADDLIEKLIARHSAPRQLLVVSSDHRLHKAARRRKAHACDSDRFLDQLERRVTRAGSAADPPDDVDTTERDLSPGELEHWLNEFSDVDVREIQAETGTVDAKSRPAEESPTSESKTKVPEVDPGDLALWKDLLEGMLDEDGDVRL